MCCLMAINFCVLLRLHCLALFNILRILTMSGLLLPAVLIFKPRYLAVSVMSVIGIACPNAFQLGRQSTALVVAFPLKGICIPYISWHSALGLCRVSGRQHIQDNWRVFSVLQIDMPNSSHSFSINSSITKLNGIGLSGYPCLTPLRIDILGVFSLPTITIVPILWYIAPQLTSIGQC